MKEFENYYLLKGDITSMGAVRPQLPVLRIIYMRKLGGSSGAHSVVLA